jgi:hypothetical protein
MGITLQLSVRHCELFGGCCKQMGEGRSPAGSGVRSQVIDVLEAQVLENLSKKRAEKSAGILVFLISIFSVRKV